MLPNRATLLTPPGAAAIAVVRISGPRTGDFLAAHFSKPLRPLRCVHGDLRDERGDVLDDPVVVLSPDAGAADINLHGGPWVVASVLELLRRNHFEVSESAGESIPFDALDAPLDPFDAPTLLEREMLAHLPLAKTEQALRMLLAQPAAWRAWIETNPSPGAIRAVREDACLRRMLCPPRVAIVGAPNVGKSTLANQLFAQERSITADLPGTTRDWVGETANLDGLAVLLVDTPGVRETSDPIERQAIARSRDVVAGADVVVLVRDATTPIDAAASIELPRAGDRGRMIVVDNKVDLRAREALGIADVRTVATTGEGIDALRQLLRARLGCADLTPACARPWTQRHHDLLTRALADPSALADI